jgi:hypothetical protein
MTKSANALLVEIIPREFKETVLGSLPVAECPYPIGASKPDHEPSPHPDSEVDPKPLWNKPTRCRPSRSLAKHHSTNAHHDTAKASSLLPDEEDPSALAGSSKEFSRLEVTNTSPREFLYLEQR